MGYGIIGFSAAGKAGKPSPSVFGDCSSQEINDEGLGTFLSKTFEGVQTLPGLPTASDSGVFAYSGDSSLSIATPATSGDAAAVWIRPIGPVTNNSGTKFWAETSVAFGSIATVQAAFFGLAVVAGLVKNFVSAASATPASNTLQAVSSIGFRQRGSTPSKLDVVYQNAAGGIVVIKSDVTNATSITSNGGTVGDLVAGVARKLGIRFDGINLLYFYVDGVVAAKFQVDSTFDQASDYGVIFSEITGANTAVTNVIDFIQAASAVASG